MAEEAPFPRGGHHHNQVQRSVAVVAGENKKRKRAPDPDFLFGAQKDSKRPSTKPRKIARTPVSKGVSTSLLPLGGGAVAQPVSGSVQKKRAFIESLSFLKISNNGTKLLGFVRDVQTEYAVVCLPNLLTGFVRGDAVHNMLRVGMMMPVMVLRATADGTKRRIELTVSPQHLNAHLTPSMITHGMSIRGQITSIEDHGCLVNIGLLGVGACFLKFDNIEGGYVLVDEDNDDDDDDGVEVEEKDKFLLNKGRIYDFTVKNYTSDSSTTAVAQLSLQKAGTRATHLTTTSHTLRTLSPGMLFSVSVEHYARNGLCVTFLDNVFRGAIDSSHLGGFFNPSNVGIKRDGGGDMWWKDVFAGSFRTVTARIIAVDSVTKIIRLSLLPHILRLSMPVDELPHVGTVIENARVIRLDPGVGALLALPSSKENKSDDNVDFSDGKAKTSVFANLKSNSLYHAISSTQCAYVHISKAIDDPKNREHNMTNKKSAHRTPDALFAKKFNVNSTVPKLRILSTSNWIDNIASCATAESIVNSVALSHMDIVPGVIYKNVEIVSSLVGGGVIVQLGLGVRGLIPATQLFDKGNVGAFQNKVRKEKYKVGNKIEMVRCLEVNVAKKRCILTAKKLLLQNDLDDPIVDFASLEPGRIATGFVSRVNKAGLDVTFYNNVFGRVTAKRLAEELGVEDPTVDYCMGDVVKTRVVKCRTRTRTISADENGEEVEGSYYLVDLSLNTSISAADAYIDDTKRNVKLLAGSILPSKCMKVLELVSNRVGSDEKYVMGFAVVSIKSKHLIKAALDKEELAATKTVEFKLPFEQIFDTYDPEVVKFGDSMDDLARQVLRVGKKVDQPGLVLASGFGLPVVSLRPLLVKTACENVAAKESSSLDEVTSVTSSTNVILPLHTTPLFMGAYVLGYCGRLDERYGAFVRFLDNLTGLVPKLKGGLDITLYESVICKIVALDVTSGKTPKILLKRVHRMPAALKEKKEKREVNEPKKVIVRPGDLIGDVTVVHVNFARAIVTMADKKFEGTDIRARIHVTMVKYTKESSDKSMMPLSNPKVEEDADQDKVTEYHPLHSWLAGNVIRNTRCVAVDVRNGITYLELTDKEVDSADNQPGTKTSSGTPLPVFIEDPSHFPTGTPVTAIVTTVSPQNSGIWVQVCPGITGFITGFELHSDVKVLNSMANYYKIGGRINCCVLPNTSNNNTKKLLYLSALAFQEGGDKQSSTPVKITRPSRGNFVVGRINYSLDVQQPPALMLALRGGLVGRCDITESDEIENWTNMPFGRAGSENAISNKGNQSSDEKETTVADKDDENNRHDETSSSHYNDGDFPRGKYVRCCLLSSSGKRGSILDVSLRNSRLNGNLKEDALPKAKDTVHAYVIETNKKGCFLRLSRAVKGRVILKELSDGFIPDPATAFPPGRLVIGKVKGICETKPASNHMKRKLGYAKVLVDMDLRESTLLENQDKLCFEDVKIGEKYRGVVTRVESYGVFVRIDNSDVFGLAHLSECSDDYIKNLPSLYEPGDLVKTLVIKMDTEKKQVGLSLKASHFDNDMDSDDDSCSSGSSNEVDNKDEEMPDAVVNSNDDSSEEIGSDDENFAAKLATVVNSEDDTAIDEDIDKGSNCSDDSSADNSSTKDTSDNDKITSTATAIDTDVGFNWSTTPTIVVSAKGATSLEEDSDSTPDDSDDDGDIDNAGKSSHKSRKKAAAKRREEQEIALRETALADGTADANPEIAGDFERLLASEPNSSEHWIKYMAYHLSLADIDSARNVANRAFDRIEFRQEGEKLNVWTALLTLELKYGGPKNLKDTMERACQHNNPKQVYLRVCEMLERDAETSRSDDAITRADDMFAKMCKKFRDKKTVWIANFQYLLKKNRHDEAHALLKRSLISLPTYKHVGVMSKFAQLEFEYGSVGRARTIFDSLLLGNPKRLDLFFVYVDKEVKGCNIEAARGLFENAVDTDGSKTSHKFSDNQMKSLFKKWYRIEDEFGDDASRHHVKVAAKAYVERSIAVKS